MKKNEVWTVKRVLHWLTGKFKEEGFSNPRLEAELAVAKAIGGDRVKVYMELPKPLTEAERAVLRDVTRRRLAHEPAAYISGFKEFYSLKFSVNKNVLIPRPETELLVAEALNAVTPGSKVLDVGTGSGAIAVTVAVHKPEALVTATDISSEALEVAEENARFHDVSIEFLIGNLFEPVKNRKFDIILSNPPYIADDYNLPEDVKREPHSALFAGVDGMNVIREFLKQAPYFLNENGKIFMEFGDGQEKLIEPLIENRFKYEFHKDLAGIPRFLEASL